MRSRSSSSWLVVVVATALLLGVAVVAAQNGPQGPNDESGPERGEALSTIRAQTQMVGQSPNDLISDSEGAPTIQNERPLEEMVGRSPNGDVGLEEESSTPTALEAVGVLSAAPGGRRFMVTLDNTAGNTPLTACPAGFHMASLYELADVTHLTYANIPGAKTLPDQGGGPVSGWWGWVRTGGNSSATNQAGTANCALWTSTDAASYGTMVRLSSNWASAATVISPWQAQTWSCSGIAPVWCVED